MNTKTSAREELARWLGERSTQLAEPQWKQLDRYLSDVEEHNKNMNLTADSGDALLLRHVADGLAAVPLLRRWTAESAVPQILDIGSGAGFIGLGIKIAWPEAVVTLLEASQKKFRFLNWTASRLGLPNLRVICGQAAPGGSRRTNPPTLERGSFDAVLGRAVAPLPEALRLALPWAHPSRGVFIAHQTDRPQPEDPALRQSLAGESASMEEIVPYRLPRESSERHLVVFRRSS